jgi:hypothetical protein
MAISVIDAETDPFKRRRVPAPFIWGYYNGEDYRVFYDTDEFVAFLKTRNDICYAHNGGKFDWHFLLPYVDPYEEILIINGRISKMMLGLCECRDSYNILPIPLSAYKKDDMDYSIMEKSERSKPANKRRIEKYLKNDCIYLYELVSRFISEYGMNLTQAGAAMKQWKKISDQAVPESTPEFYYEMSEFYYGGRVQCFESGIIDADFSVYDINSAYPHAMTHKHPYSTNFKRVDGYQHNADFYTVRCISRGAFPERRGNGGVVFPDDGEMRYYYVTGWEYRAALDTKTISRITVLESITFCGHTDFIDYVKHFYNKRLECKAAQDDAGSLFAKLLMNSLYGKFAANPEAYKNYMVVPMEVIGGLDNLGWKFAGEFGPWGLASSPLEDNKMHFYNVATGASITGFVRAMLWRAICASKGVMYCDTDSIAVRSAGKLALGDKLGQWKHEGTFDRAGIAGKKMYIFRPVSRLEDDYKTASKGVRLTHAELWKVAKGGIVEYERENPSFSVKRAPIFIKREVRKTA